MNHSLLKPTRFFYGHRLLLLCTIGFCSDALGNLLFGAEQPAKHAELWTRIADVDVVYIGENHASRKDHAYEFELIRAMIRSRMRFAVGWEMFERGQQADLDRFDQGRLSLAELFARTGFQKSWATYSPLYARILETTAQANIPNIGLNAPTTLAHRLAAGEPLSLSEKKQVPTEFWIPAGAYRHFVRLLGEHPGMKQDELPRFFAAQNLWDQTMAKTILDFQKKNPATKLLVLTGRGHVQDGFGIPNYVRQKSAAKQSVLLP
ncbi:MAG: ChaN family lipoprotein [Verrucomicrobia bacterium]|nr:ChaN family lipoprotein [Verrucomicrobiota bacterium]MBV8278344.1 ChaN family lipoprotein [Verrucomicrobiota bacterium]